MATFLKGPPAGPGATGCNGIVIICNSLCPYRQTHFFVVNGIVICPAFANGTSSLLHVCQFREVQSAANERKRFFKKKHLFQYGLSVVLIKCIGYRASYFHTSPRSNKNTNKTL